MGALADQIFRNIGEATLDPAGPANQGITTGQDSLLQLDSRRDPAARTISDSEPATSPPSAAWSLSTSPSRFDHDFGRDRQGHSIADFELSTTRALTAVPVLFCLSTSIIDHVDTYVEDKACVTGIGEFAMKYMTAISRDRAHVPDFEARFGGTNKSEYKDLDNITGGDEYRDAVRINQQSFAADRAWIWDQLERATNEFFDGLGGEVEVGRRDWRVVVKAARDFATGLEDEETAELLWQYWGRES